MIDLYKKLVLLGVSVERIFVDATNLYLKIL